MEITNYKRKLKTLFEKFTQKNYHLRPYYPKAIVKYFENCSEKSKYYVRYGFFNVETKCDCVFKLAITFSIFMRR